MSGRKLPESDHDRFRIELNPATKGTECPWHLGLAGLLTHLKVLQSLKIDVRQRSYIFQSKIKIYII